MWQFISSPASPHLVVLSVPVGAIGLGHENQSIRGYL